MTVAGCVREKEMSLLLEPWCDVALSWKESFSLGTRTASELGRKKQSAEAKQSMAKNNVCENQEWNLLLSSLSPFSFSNDICHRLLSKSLVLCAANTPDGPAWHLRM